MGLLRLTIRVIALLFWTFGLWFVRVAFWPVGWISEPTDRRWRRFWFRLWARGYAWIIGMRVVVRGSAPAPPFYLVANHLSYLDIVVLVHQTGCGFVARGDIAHWPVLGIMCRSLHILFVDRASKRDAMRVNGDISRTLGMGDGIAVFAESRISVGRDVEPFKSALIQPALTSGIPVHYATLTYATRPGYPPASRVVGWWRPEPLLHHFSRYLKQPGCVATITFGEAPLVNADRKVLALELHAAVRRNFEPVA